MSSKSKTIMNIVSTGDVTMDWNLARVNRGTAKELTWNPDDSTHACWQRGGAALLADLIAVIAKDLEAGSDNDYSLFQTGAPTEPVDPSNSRYHHSYAIWSLYKEKGQMVWRVAEFLGIDRSTVVGGKQSDWQFVLDDPAAVDLLVIDDAAMGFRDFQKYWPRCLVDQQNHPWIILKMSQPVGQGLLWEHLLKHYSDRLIVLTTVSDLRRTEVQISKGLSWERTAQDVTWELMHNHQINHMSRCACVVVSFGAAGAVIHTNIPTEQVSTKPALNKSQLVFAPGLIEGVWEANHLGGMIGYTTCLVGGIARELMRSPDSADLLKGVQTGLEAIRDLHLGGYENIGSADQPRVRFPLGRVAQRLSLSTAKFAVVDIQDPVQFLTAEARADEHAPEGGYWTILQERYRGDLEDVCKRIVLEGAETVLSDVPQGVFGGLFTVDRQEIESYRSISTLAGEYLNQIKPKRPLSIAVFGAPGSGKSFGITQVANALAPGRIKVLEFNLSQFGSIDELGDALHQVRDANLSGKFPLVFWDEFDTPLSGTPLGWLRYFLAPMQDGAFREGQIVHPIGPAIFVFAGGTSERMASFGSGLDEETFRGSKVPDFISRLKGFVNVLGPNPQGSKIGEPSAGDPFYIIRRAILFRSILWRNAGHLFQPKDGMQFPNIDKGVLRAFLKTRFYKHGIRSMESIVAMSQLAGNTKYERSSLPPEVQLDLHVDGQEFLALVQQIELTKETLDKLAILFHKNFCTQLEKQGYVYGKVTDDDAKRHSSLIDFYELPEDEQEQNRDTVRHIHSKLAASGYIMVPARSNEPPFEFPGTFLDELAIMEHERWMRMKFTQGWQGAPVTDKDNKAHADLVPWEELSESAKDKDKAFVKAIPGILAKAGYTVVKLRPMKEGG
jgi:hypothetical protein